jgi:hypothetical protein
LPYLKLGVTLNESKLLVTQAYNSPLGLYSKQNVADALITTVKKYYALKFLFCFFLNAWDFKFELHAFNSNF